MEYTKYAAVGHFKCHRTLAGKKYPVVIVGQKEYMLDVQEMTVWSSLGAFFSRSQIAEAYLKLTRGLSFTSRRTLDDCIDRLVSRELVAEGAAAASMRRFMICFPPVHRAGFRKSIPADWRIPETLDLGRYAFF